jgi:cyclopropane fatty-acyl-phospholipid synthase-like methyltransferase
MLQAALLVILAITLLICFSLLLYHGLTGVPTMSSTRAEAAEVVALLRQARLGENPTIVDLGCGWGSLAIALASAFPDARIVGIEISPFPYWRTRLRALRHSNVSVSRTDLFRFDLRSADAVVCYLMMKPMVKLAGFGR